MTRFWLWVFLSCVAIVAAFFGLCDWRDMRHDTSAIGIAFFLHSLFGEDA